MKDDTVEALAILIVEKGEKDARLMIDALRRGGLEASSRRVDTLSSLEAALESQEWDVVLSAYNLPGFDAWETLRRVLESQPNAPFILVSGAIGEEEAVAFVKAGAADFVLQSDLTRLPTAVTRAIAETKYRGSQRELEDCPRASESRYRALLDSLPDLVFVLTADGVFVDCHGANPKWLPGSRESLLGRSLSDVFPPHVVRQVEPVLRDVVRDGSFRQVAYPLDLPSGRRYLDSRLTRMGDGRILSVVRDVTRIKEAEQRLHDILEHSTNLFYSYTPDHLLDYVSPQSIHFLGCEPERALAPFPDYFSDDPVNEAGLQVSNRAIETGESQPAYALELATRDGRKLWVEVNEAPVVRDGRTMSMVGSLTDVTARKRAENERAEAEHALRLAQRMESIGRLAGGVAHDFNNLLSVILGYTSFAMETSRPGEPLYDDLVEIRKAGERATDLTRQLLAFSRRQVLRPSVLDLNDVVAKTEKLLRRVLGEDIELVTRLSQDLHVVYADEGQIEQILMNLAVNGRDAMSDGGRLVVETANAEVEPSFAEARPPMVPGSYVLLRISDTGSGMPKTVLDKVFEPFFTTKELGKGTGLGLSTVYGIVKQSNGFIWIDSEPDEGTAFSIYLPPCRQEASPSLVTPGDEPETVGSKTVLVVEDERAVRLLAQRILEKAGYDVIATKDATEALAQCERFGGAIHLLLTDVVMPRTNGRELAERISTIRPQIKVLFMSGYSEEMIAHHGVLELGTDLIAKPFDPEELTRKVREVLRAV